MTGLIHCWLEQETKNYFDTPIQKILDERQPASIGKFYLQDLLIESNPEMARYPEKVLRQCITVSMKKKGWMWTGKRRRAFWRPGEVEG